MRFRQHPRVAVPRVATVPTVTPIPRAPTAPRVAKIPPSHGLPGTKLVPTAAALPHLIPPDTPRYPFRHRRHHHPTLIRARYTNADTFLDRFQANAVIHPITGALQEFFHLIAGPDKANLSQSLANEFG